MPVGDLAGPVVRTIIDHQHVQTDAGGRARYLIQNIGQIAGLVEGGNHHHQIGEDPVREFGVEGAARWATVSAA